MLHFLDPNEEPVVLLHQLRLHPLNGKPPNVRVPVVAEFQEDIVFMDPGCVGVLRVLVVAGR